MTARPLGLRLARLAWAGLASACVLLAGCGTTNAGQPLSPSAMAEVGGIEWTLTHLSGQTLAADGRSPTLLLSTGQPVASGFTGCNRFTGSYELGPTQLRFGPLAMTRAACLDATNPEDRYMAALVATRSYRLAGKDLELRGEDGVLARFRRP